MCRKQKLNKHMYILRQQITLSFNQEPSFSIRVYILIINNKFDLY